MKEETEKESPCFALTSIDLSDRAVTNEAHRKQEFNLYHGDCLDVLRSLPSASADIVITDPPYCSGGYLEAQKNTKAQGLRGATVNAEGFEWFASDNMSTGGLVWLMRSVMIEIKRILRPNTAAYVFTDWRMVSHLAPVLESSGLHYRNMIIWDKGNAGLGVGFKPAYEVIMEFANGNPSYQAKTGQNVLRINRVPSAKKMHGAEKPVELIKRILTVAAPQGCTVLDPFMGSGAIGIAALKLGCSFIGIERESKYIEIARKQLESTQAQSSLFGEAV